MFSVRAEALTLFAFVYVLVSTEVSREIFCYRRSWNLYSILCVSGPVRDIKPQVPTSDPFAPLGTEFTDEVSRCLTNAHQFSICPVSLSQVSVKVFTGEIC